MKKTIFLLSIGVLLIACNNHVLLDLEYDDPNSSCVSTTWQEQVEYAKNKKGTKTRVAKDQIVLEGYSYKGKINSNLEISNLIEQLFLSGNVRDN